MEAIAGIIGCVTLFLYAIHSLSRVFQDLFSEQAKRILQRYTSNLIKSIFIGFILTLLLDSSSAVIILTIIFINAKTLDLKRGIGIALGSNIGTTIQSQLFAFDIMQYSFILLIIGIVHVFLKDSIKQKYLTALFYLGMLFFSLFSIGELVSQPEIFNYIKDWLYQDERSAWVTALAGGVFTLIIQSSGAMVGLVITLAKTGLVTKATGIAIMMGAELGTTSNTLVAAIGGRKSAVQLAMFNLLFNILSITTGLLLFSQFNQLIEFLFPNTSIARQIANAHILFNVIGVFLTIPLVKPYIWLTAKWQTSKTKSSRSLFLPL